jgi:general secretion pathway protein G
MKKSFTLIELIVVIAIIAVLAAIIAPNAFRAIEKAKVSAALADFKTYKTALGALYADTGHWIADDYIGVGPVTTHFKLNPGETPFDVNPTQLANWSYVTWAGWDGPYLETLKGMHPWGGCYIVGWLADFDGNGIEDLRIELDNWCYGAAVDLGCGVPKQAQIRIDQALDDGNLSTGIVQKWPLLPPQDDIVCWIMEWDYRDLP